VGTFEERVAMADVDFRGVSAALFGVLVAVQAE
jgi:hypothetical protein